MPIEKHDLHAEFPEYNDRIHELKADNHHFSNLFTQYDDLTHKIHNFETGSEVTSDDYLEEMKKKRLLLKDELFAMLRT